jgi:hypothetical protein
LPVQTRNTKKAKKASIMLTRKNAQKRLAAATAHLDELLDEALKATFPASDPIAINVEPQIARAGNSDNAPGAFHRSI